LPHRDNGDDLVLGVNKGNAQIGRWILRGAAKKMSPQQLVNYSPFSPDEAYRIGDIEEGLQRDVKIAGGA
jgi:hypothetical protein